MHTEAKPDQARRIRRAIEKAVMRRDRYADAHVADLTKALKAASDDVAKQIRRFEEQAALKPWQERRLAILKDLAKLMEMRKPPPGKNPVGRPPKPKLALGKPKAEEQDPMQRLADLVHAKQAETPGDDDGGDSPTAAE